MDYKKSKAPVNTVTRNIMDLCEDTGSVLIRSARRLRTTSARNSLNLPLITTPSRRSSRIVSKLRSHDTTRNSPSPHCWLLRSLSRIRCIGAILPARIHQKTANHDSAQTNAFPFGGRHSGDGILYDLAALHPADAVIGSQPICHLPLQAPQGAGQPLLHPHTGLSGVVCGAGSVDPTRKAPRTVAANGSFALGIGHTLLHGAQGYPCRREAGACCR